MAKASTKTLTEDELKTLKKKAFEVLSNARHQLLAKYPFIGSIALRMDLIPVRDKRIRTACTDGNAVYFDIAFLSSLSTDEQKFVLAHEIWHAVLLHLTRRGNRNPTLFNIATDKEVNYLLKEDGLIPPENLCFPDEDEVGKSAEEIYEMLLKKMKKQQKNNNGKNQKNGSGKFPIGNGNPSSTQVDGNNDDTHNNDGTGSGGNKDGKLEGQFDKHVYEGDEDEKDNSRPDENGGNQPGKNGKDGEGAGNSITDKYGEVGYDADFKPTIAKGFADRMRETVISEAQRVEKMRGSVPSHVKEFIKKLMTPEVKWEEVLAQFVTRCYNSGSRSWIPPNRRHIHNDVYLQSRQASKIRLACIIDTSGSTMGDRGKFMAELNSLIKSFGMFDLYLIECDAEVGAIKHFTQDDNLEQIIEAGEYTMTGGGGTAMTPGLQAIIDEQMEVDAALVLTDGFIEEIPTNPTGLPTLWIITKDGTEDFCDWGQKIRLKTNDEDIG